MQTGQVPIWRTLGGALSAPFMLSLASWKALAGPLLVFAGANLFGVVANEGRLGELAWAPALLLALAAVAWLALGFQRQLLLGAAAREPGTRPWRRYGLYLLAIATVGLLLGILAGMLLALALPAMAWFLMALNSPNPWIAAGSVVLGFIAYGVAAYAPARLALVLPALAVDHAAGPARIWRLSRSNGLRLLALLVIVPGLLHGLLEFALPADDSALPTIAGVLLSSYLLLVDLAILAFAYRALSDEALPAVIPDRVGPRTTLSARIAWPLALVVLVSLGGAALWDALYRVEPGEVTLITRHGKPERIDSQPGIRFKIPFIEAARSISDAPGYRSEGEGRFLTVYKNSLSLRYLIDWRITDAETYARAVAGETARANVRIEDVATNLLRYRVAKLSSDEIGRLIDAGSAEQSIHDELGPDALLGDVLEKSNARTRELGIEITTWRVEVEAKPAS